MESNEGMQALSIEQVNLISGGVDNAEANQRIGEALGSAYHGLTSNEAMIGLFFGGFGGAIAGAVYHMKSKH